MCAHLCAHLRTHACGCVCVRSVVGVPDSVRACAHACGHCCAREGVRAAVWVRARVCAHVCVLHVRMHACMGVHMHACMHAPHTFKYMNALRHACILQCMPSCRVTHTQRYRYASFDTSLRSYIQSDRHAHAVCHDHPSRATQLGAHTGMQTCMQAGIRMQ